MLDRRLFNAALEHVALLQHWGRLGRVRGAGGRARLHAVGPSPYDRRAQVVTSYSPTLGVAKRLHIYLPPGYAESHQRYPVVYLLRGHEREWLNIEEDTSRHGLNVIDVYERLFQAGQVGPLILVMPGLTSDDETAHGLGTSSSPGLGGRPPEQAPGGGKPTSCATSSLLWTPIGGHCPSALTVGSTGFRWEEPWPRSSARSFRRSSAR